MEILESYSTSPVFLFWRMNVPKTLPQGKTPLLAIEFQDNEKEGENPVQGLFPKRKAANSAQDFDGGPYPQDQTSQSNPTPSKMMDECPKPFLSFYDEVDVINDSVDDIAAAQLSKEQSATIEADNAALANMIPEDADTVRAYVQELDDILVLDVIANDAFDEEMEAMDVKKLVNMYELPGKEQEVEKIRQVTPVLNGITAMPQYNKKAQRTFLKDRKKQKGYPGQRSASPW